MDLLNQALAWLFEDVSLSGSLAVWFALGAGIGWALGGWIDRLVHHYSQQQPFSQRPVRPTWLGRVVVMVGTGLMFAIYLLATVHLESQKTPAVRPGQLWSHLRLLYHLILLSLLVVATGVDWRCYLVPDQITIPGMLIAVLAAAASGQLQIIHLWIDWNQEIPGLVGPYIPEWIQQHVHWHGLAWSIAGLLAGGGVTWLVRELSHLLLRGEALGFGDVTLMAMIGSFVGWQPTVFIFLLAPLCGLLASLLLRLVTSRRILPYGPYLSAATLVVLATWRWLWMPTRYIFGHPPSLALLAAVALTALVVLLILLRLYRSIPVR